ncbi:MAG: hypothetical protein QM726_11165 [Chitinophagaceae bacterium]
MKLLKYFTTKKEKAALLRQQANIEIKYYEIKSKPSDTTEPQHQVHITRGFKKNFVAN